MVSFVPHYFVPLPLVLSLFPTRYSQRLQLSFHAILTFCYLFIPSLFLAPLVDGKLDPLHVFLQRYASIFHIAYAYFLVYAPRSDRSVFFGRFISALMILTSHLFTTYRLYETNARGVRLNHQFLFVSLAIYGVWLAAELWQFIFDKSGYNEEIDAMCQRTRRWVETRDTRSTDNLLFFDSAFIASNAFLHFAFPHQILKTTIKSEYALDAVHLMLARQYGAYLIAFAFVSVLAVHFTLKNQRIYVLSRIIMQMSLVVLNVLGHWSDSVYHTQHIIPFMISAFYITFLISLFYRLQRIDDRAWNGEKITITRRMKSPSMEGRHGKEL